MKDFFARYESQIMPIPFCGCWIWTGGATTGRKSVGFGYGLVTHCGERIYTHRAAYECAHGSGSAKGLMVRHTCDIPLCVNPDHLLLGTNLDNMRDMRERGRSNFGSRNGMARLTAEQIIEIKRLRDEGLSQGAIGLKFGIDQSAVSLILSGKRWGATDKIAGVQAKRTEHRNKARA